MNFPDFETSKTISSQFESSEFAYYDGPYNEPTVVKKADNIAWIFLCNAPTCEELGEWFRGKGFDLTREWCGIGKWILYRNNSHFAFIDGDLNETQARAEAVRLIIAPPSS